MSQTETTTTTETTPKTSTKKAAPVKTAAKKATTSIPAPTKGAKKATTEVKAAPKAEVKAPETAKEVATKKSGTASGLKRPQERILKFLASQEEAMSRAAIAEFAPVDVAACVEYIGSHIEEKRLANDTKHFPSLISLGYVKFALPVEGSRGVVYSITAKGKQIAAKIPAE